MKNFQVYLKTNLMGAFSLLEFEPDGLSDYKNKLLRDEIYNTVSIDTLLDMRFVKDGYDILKAAYDTDAHFATCEIKINELNTETNTYVEIFTGYMDYSEYREDDIYIEIPINSSEKTVLLRSRDRNKYALESTETTDNDPVIALEALKDITLPEFDFEGDAEAIQEVTFFSEGDLALNNDIDFNVTEVFTVISNHIGAAFTADSGLGMFVAPSDGNVTETGSFRLKFDGSLTGEINPSVFIQMRIILTRTQGSVITELYNQLFVAIDQVTEKSIYFTVDQSFNLDSSYEIASGAKVKYEVSVNLFSQAPGIPPLTNHYRIDFDGTITTDYSLLFNQGHVDETDVKMWFPYEAMFRQINLMTSESNSNNILRSEVLARKLRPPYNFAVDGKWAALMVFAGKSLYGGETNLSFRDLFESLNAIDPMGFWYNKAADRFELEPISNWYKDEEIAVFNKVSNFQQYVDKDQLYSSISGGYDNNESNDYVNGVLEFNTNMEHSTIIKNSSNTLQKQSPVRADIIGINDKRLRFQRNELSEDKKTDDHVFFVDCELTLISTIPEVITGADYNAVIGLENKEQWFNLGITPRQNTKRQGYYYNPALIPEVPTSKIKYVNGKSTNNIGIQKLVADPVEYERDDIQPNEATQPLLSAKVYEFDVEVSRDDRIAIKANPHGYVTVIDDGITYAGFIKVADLNNSKNEAHFVLTKKA